MRTLLRGTTLLLGVIALALTGCEEMAEKPPAATPLYKDADLAAIKERWQHLAPPRGGSRTRAAAVAHASTDLFPDEAILDARTYGTCDVFNLQLDDHPTISILDCVDQVEQHPGHYHVAATCVDIPEDYAGEEHNGPAEHLHGRVVYLRAGSRERPRPEMITATVVGETAEYRVEFSARTMIYRWDEALYGTLVGKVATGAGRLTFSISHGGHVDTGQAALTSNYAAAATEHRQRCAAF